MPPLNPPSSRHAGAPDAKIHKLAYGFGQYEFWPRPTLACRAADKAGTRYPADCNIRAGFSAQTAQCRDAACSVSNGGDSTVMPAAEPAPWEALARMAMAQCRDAACSVSSGENSTVMPAAEPAPCGAMAGMMIAGANAAMAGMAMARGDGATAQRCNAPQKIPARTLGF